MSFMAFVYGLRVRPPSPQRYPAYVASTLNVSNDTRKIEVHGAVGGAAP